MSKANAIGRGDALAFVEDYGRAWESWDMPRFVGLFSDEVVYVAHPTETVVGRAALETYLRKEQAEQGDVSVRMGLPVAEGDHVAAEFWVTATTGAETTTIAGCFIAQLAADGRCELFREYWFDIEGDHTAYEEWGK
jgi:hypothetical protein